MRSQIIGSGFVTGENLVTNDQLARIMDTSDAWIRERSGVETRYYVELGTTTSDLGAGAARKCTPGSCPGRTGISCSVAAARRRPKRRRR